MRSLQTLAAWFDAQALDQLRIEVVRLAEENERLRINYANVAYAANSLHEENINLQCALCEAMDGKPGLDISGKLVVIQDSNNEKHHASSDNDSGSFVSGLLFHA